jgi:hypothetical protein
MQSAAIAIVVAFVTLTSSSAISQQISSNPEGEPKTQATVNASVADAAAAAAEAVSAGISLDVLEQPADHIRGPASASMEQICSTLETAASHHELPVAFFARLIWQESRFRIDARSPVGARGIAQFMPGTAEWRGLADPLDPIESLRKSADYLRELRNQFGNLGLAAAAYNGGSGRVQSWLKGRGKMPRETRDYVRIVTGSPIEEWRAKDGMVPQAGRIPLKVPCPAMVAMASASEPDPVVTKVREAAPVLAVVSKPSRRAKGAESRSRVRIAGNATPVLVVEETNRRGKGAESRSRVRIAGNATPVLVVEETNRRGKGAKSRSHMRTAGNVAKAKADRVKPTARGRKPAVASRRVPGRGNTAMNDQQIERRAARL